MPADVGTGVSIAFGTSGFTAEILDINGTAIEREVIDSSHHGTSVWRTFIPGDLANPGESTFEFHFDPDEQPPVNAAAETITITFPLPTGGITAATFACSGFISSWEWNVPFEDKMTGTATIKWSGLPTWTDST